MAFIIWWVLLLLLYFYLFIFCLVFAQIVDCGVIFENKHCTLIRSWLFSNLNPWSIHYMSSSLVMKQSYLLAEVNTEYIWLFVNVRCDRNPGIPLRCSSWYKTLYYSISLDYSYTNNKQTLSTWNIETERGIDWDMIQYNSRKWVSELMPDSIF